MSLSPSNDICQFFIRNSMNLSREENVSCHCVLTQFLAFFTISLGFSACAFVFSHLNQFYSGLHNTLRCISFRSNNKCLVSIIYRIYNGRLALISLVQTLFSLFSGEMYSTRNKCWIKVHRYRIMLHSFSFANSLEQNGAINNKICKWFIYDTIWNVYSDST